MLILNRDPGERIYLQTSTGERIVVTYLGQNGAARAARIGIDAPKSVQIVREELVDPIERPTPDNERQGILDDQG